MQNKFKLSSDSGDSDSKKCKQGYGGVWWGSGVRSQAVCFVLVHLAGICLQSREDYSYLIWFINKFTNFVLLM
jgi:hypothetical protein